MDPYGATKLGRTLYSGGRPTAVRTPPPPVLRRKQGTITAVATGGKRVDVTLSASTVVISGCDVDPAYLKPAVGDTCWVTLNGTDVTVSERQLTTYTIVALS